MGHSLRSPLLWLWLLWALQLSATEDKKTRSNIPKVKMRWEGHTFPGRLESLPGSDFQDVHTEEAVRLQQYTAHHRGFQEGATRRQQTMTLSSLQLHRLSLGCLGTETASSWWVSCLETAPTGIREEVLREFTQKSIQVICLWELFLRRHHGGVLCCAEALCGLGGHIRLEVSMEAS